MRNGDETNKFDQLCKLNHRLSRMSPVQKKIADYLRTDPQIVSSLTITRLARKIGVDPASITRFCQLLGFSGYSDFKFSIERNYLSPLPADDALFKVGGSVTERIQHMGAVFQQTIGDMILLLDRQDMGKAAKCLAEAGTVHAYAHGGSSASIQYAHTLFMQIGIPCYPFSDPSISTAAASQLGAGDAAIGVSSSGTSKVSIDAMSTAKKHGATVIAITGFSNSPMGQMADINLCYHSRLKDDIRCMHLARMCEVAIFGILQMLILDGRSEKVGNRLETIQRAMRQGRYGSEASKKTT